MHQRDDGNGRVGDGDAGDNDDAGNASSLSSPHPKPIPNPALDSRVCSVIVNGIPPSL